jgi:FeS assembly SUF system protein
MADGSAGPRGLCHFPPATDHFGDDMKQLPVVQPPPPDAPQATNETAMLVRDEAKTAALKPAIVKAISTVFDPEIPVNIYELGLIYDILVDANGTAGVTMTLTAPGCPVAHTLPVEVANKVKAVEGVTDAKVDIVWEPAWTKDRMSDAAKLQLGLW